MIQTIIGLLTYLTASIQDHKEQQVSIIILTPFYTITLLLQSIPLFITTTIAIATYYFIRQNYEIRTGIGTADLILTAPTILTFNKLNPLLVIIILYSFTITKLYLTDKKKTAAIPTMTIGYITLITITQTI